MVGGIGVIFLPDDRGKTGRGLPLMLCNVMGVPLLRWLSYAMAGRNISRVFLVCHAAFSDLAKHCFPPETTVVCPEDQDIPAQLTAFLGQAAQAEMVTVVTGPAVMIDGPADVPSWLTKPQSGVFSLDVQTLQAALDEQVSLLEFLRTRGVSQGMQDGVFAVGSPLELAQWQGPICRQGLQRLLRQGVEIWDLANTYVEPTVKIGSGTVLLPGTILRGNTVIGSQCVIGPNTLMEDVTVGDGTKINASQLYDCAVGNRTAVGPFAYIRPQSQIGDQVKVGDFVEVKNSTIGNGSKVSHLSYVGDSDVGQNVNFGCGAVTVNYDRAQKFRTTIEDNAFIGCNTNLVAPVTVGRGGYTGAGSTITENVPQNALAIARTKQSNKREWAAKHKVK